MTTILRDYQHAKKLFIADTHKYAPKQSFLYYVCLNTVNTPGILFTGGEDSSLSLQEQYEAGMLVKSIQLPSFNLNSKVMNNYNRKEVVHTKIEYTPINVTFHDDAADLILRFWNDYYTHYYRDSDYEEQRYQTNDKYDGIPQFPQWGMNPRNQNPYLRTIQIYSLHNKRFTEYTLINPHITDMKHGQHDSSQSTGTMEISMTFAYETVKYSTGFVNPVDVNGFATLRYDNTESPLGGSFINTQQELGILGAITGSKSDLSRPAGTSSGGGLLGTIANTARLFKATKDANLGALAKATAIQAGAQGIKNILEGKSAFPTSISGGIADALGGLGGGIGASVSGMVNNLKSLGKVDVNGLKGKAEGLSKDLSKNAQLVGFENFAKETGASFGGLGTSFGGLGGAVEGGLYANTSDADLTYSGDDPIIISRINRERVKRGMAPLDEASGGGAE